MSDNIIEEVRRTAEHKWVNEFDKWQPQLKTKVTEEIVKLKEHHALGGAIKWWTKL